MSAQLHIVCFGNLLQGDDGFGVHVAQALRGRTPPTVSVFDAGLAGAGALAHFEGCAEVIVVDALEWHGEEGRVHELELSEVDAPEHAFSAHELDVNHLAHVLPIVFEGRTQPRVRVLGAEIRRGDGTFTMTLSPGLARAHTDVVSRLRSIAIQWHEAQVAAPETSLGGSPAKPLG